MALKIDNIIDKKQRFHPINEKELNIYIKGLIGNNSNNKTLDLTNVDVSNISDFRVIMPLEKMNNIEHIIIDGWDMSNADYTYELFMSLHKVKTISMYDVQFPDRMDISALFNSCESLEHVYIDWAEYSDHKVIGIDRLFNNCFKIEDIGENIGLLDVSNVKEFSSVFNFCQKMKHIDISKWDMHNAESISGIFCQCNSLEELKLPEKMPTKGIRNLLAFTDVKPTAIKFIRYRT